MDLISIDFTFPKLSTCDFDKIGSFGSISHSYKCKTRYHVFYIWPYVGAKQRRRS